MNDFAVWPCASPSPARSGSWRPRWIPRGAPFKNIDFGSYKLWLDFSRFLTHLVLWNSTGGHSVQDADLTNSIKILLIHRNPQKTSQNEGFRMVPGGSRQRGCRAGYALGRHAGRVSQFRLEVEVERFFKKLVFGTLLECPGFSTSCRAHARGPRRS